jgi:hypothetical protein
VSKYFVALDGNDSWSGRLATPNSQQTDGPFATLERGRDEIRSLKQATGLPRGGVIIEIRGGTYQRTQPFVLTAADSGDAQAPVIYRARAGENVLIDGGRRVARFARVSHPEVLQRLAPNARAKVFQSDLQALGIVDYGTPRGGGLELFFNNQPLGLARWPNEGFLKIVRVGDDNPVVVRETSGNKTGKFVYDGTRPSRWMQEPDGWLHGYWYWDWSDEREKIASIDSTHQTITLVPPYHWYGYREGQWYYAYNLLSELDRPGEWYLDRDAGTVFLWPPGDLASASVVATLAQSLVSVDNASYVALRGITFQGARATAITIRGGTHAEIDRCLIRNVGGWGVRIMGGAHHGVSDCEINATGEGGIFLDGGDRKTLTRSGHYARNNQIHHYSRWKRTYQAAIELSGVGHLVAHNLIHDAPHEAIALSGNDHVIELNEIHDVCQETIDAGAIVAGRDWTMRGNVIRHNFMHHISGFENRGCSGVMLDDMFSGTRVTGNVFYRVARAVLVGGGRDNLVSNNVFVDCAVGVYVDARAGGWAAETIATDMKPRLLAMPYRDSPWRDRYPSLANILDDNPAAPKGNGILRNISWRGRLHDIVHHARPWVRLDANLVSEDPRFVDPAHLNFQLRADSPAFKLGFERIPIEKIGPQQQ